MSNLIQLNPSSHVLIVRHEIRYGVDTWVVYLDTTELCCHMSEEMAMLKARLFKIKLNDIINN